LQEEKRGERQVSKKRGVDLRGVRQPKERVVTPK